MVTGKKIRVGIIGASAHGSWGTRAHLPALQAMPDYEVTAVCTTRQETADETAKLFGIPHALGRSAATRAARRGGRGYGLRPRTHASRVRHGGAERR